MNGSTNWYDGYRAWEDRYIAMLDALNAGRDPGPDWAEGAYRRRMVAKTRCMSNVERQQLRDFIWRYRGWRGWVALLALIAANCLIGLMLSLASPKIGLVEGMVLMNVGVGGIGLSVVAVWFNPGQLTRFRGRAFLILPILALAGALVGASVSAVVAGESPIAMFARVGGKTIVAGLAVGLVLTLLLALIVSLRNRELRAANAQLAAETAQQRLAGEVTASRLRLLRAQIEPHFLFNTLGAVQQLAEGKAPDAAALTAHLIRFLRNSMGSFNDAGTTLGDEATVVASYLEIMQSRLGQRLAFTIEVPEALRHCPVQPTLLLNFVENAIKHGIERAPRGGTIRVSASRRASDATLTVEVADTGVGMGEAIGEGNGLRNAREQLALAYGGRASLDLVENEPSGLIVRMSFPCKDVARGAAA